MLLQSRQQRSLTRYFPEIAAGIVDQLPRGTVLDGELVVYCDGRLDFAALQQRIRPSAMHAARRGAVLLAALVVFDVLAVAGEDLRARPPGTPRRAHRRDTVATRFKGSKLRGTGCNAECRWGEAPSDLRCAVRAHRGARPTERDPALVDENGEKPGFRVVFNANPRSADYNPGNRNRLARYLAAAGKSAPEIAQMKPRQLNRRQQVIAELAAEAAGNPMGKAANPETMGWKTCPSCAAVVVDLDKHRAVSSAC